VTRAAPRHALIAPAMTEVWRPFMAFGALACTAVVVGTPAIVAGSSTAAAVVVSAVVVILGLACARTLTWRLLPARVTVSYDTSGLFVERGTKVLRQYIWSDIREVELVPGYRWPEWSRWAMFAHLRVVGRADSDLAVDDSPGLLLVRPRRVQGAQEELKDVADRFIGGRARP
jgi:hypothetical protein